LGSKTEFLVREKLIIEAPHTAIPFFIILAGSSDEEYACVLISPVRYV
jgi:hypothetical protein